MSFYSRHSLSDITHAGGAFLTAPKRKSIWEGSMNVMNHKVLIVALFMELLFLSGCAVRQSNLAETGDFFLQIVPTPIASVTKEKAYLEQEALVITGKVRKQHQFYLPGKVHIAIYDPSGALLEEANQRISGHASKRGGAKEARFSVRFNHLPPKGSTVRLEYRAAAVQH